MPKLCGENTVKDVRMQRRQKFNACGRCGVWRLKSGCPRVKSEAIMKVNRVKSLPTRPLSQDLDFLIALEVIYFIYKIGIYEKGSSFLLVSVGSQRWIWHFISANRCWKKHEFRAEGKINIVLSFQANQHFCADFRAGVLEWPAFDAKVE